MEFEDKSTVVEVKENKDEERGKLTFDEQVIQKIVAMIIKDTDGVSTIKSSGGAFSGIVGRGSSESINVEVGETEVAVDLRLILKYGKNAKDIFNELKSEIEKRVNEMTGLIVVEVNVKIEDVLSEEEFESRNQ